MKGVILLARVIQLFLRLPNGVLN
ncbi:hypothetical protein RDABS01_010195 [Bienertia sinuspersici]